MINTDESMIDYHLTVANQIGFSPLLPNVPSEQRFCFELDLKKPYLGFKGKHVMLGFDPAGLMLFIDVVIMKMCFSQWLRINSFTVTPDPLQWGTPPPHHL
jgi:hypothetical protein